MLKRIISLLLFLVGLLSSIIAAPQQEAPSLDCKIVDQTEDSKEEQKTVLSEKTRKFFCFLSGAILALLPILYYACGPSELASQDVSIEVINRELEEPRTQVDQQLSQCGNE